MSTPEPVAPSSPTGEDVSATVETGTDEHASGELPPPPA